LDQNIIELFRKYMDRQCSSAELEKVLSIIESGIYPDELEYALTQDADQVIAAGDDTDSWNELSKLNLHHKLSTSINAAANITKPKRFNLAIKMTTIAAAASILLFFGWFLYNSKNTEVIHNEFANDVAPGKSGATLRLQNGKVINLNGGKTGVVIKDSQVSYIDGSSVGVITTPSAIEQYSASTAQGNTYMVTLPDGTEVWLNAASKLDFPSRFDGQNRKVSIEGEAFFKVSKDKNHPFIVESNGQQLRVLGTQFNINSYPDEKSINTTLIEGSVQVNAADQRVLLKPGQQSTIVAGQTIVVSEVDTTLATAWKNNKFIFENNDIQSVMRMIQRWYNVEVVYDGALPDASFGGKVSRFNNVSNVLHVLEVTGGAHFKIKGRTIYVTK
jgi:transmembrane sensor